MLCLSVSNSVNSSQAITDRRSTFGGVLFSSLSDRYVSMMFYVLSLQKISNVSYICHIKMEHWEFRKPFSTGIWLSSTLL